MKFAYYEVVSGQEEKELRLREIRASVGKDPDYYSSYLEVSPCYNASRNELQALHSMKAAIRKGKIQLLVIPSLKNLHMAEDRAVSLLLDLMAKGIKIALSIPENIQTEKDILSLALESQLEYIGTVLSAPLITMENCVIHFCARSAFIYLGKNAPKPENAYGHIEKVLFINAVRMYQHTGFFFYRPDVQPWYYIPDYMAAIMIEYFEIAYKTLYEVLDLELPLP